MGPDMSTVMGTGISAVRGTDMFYVYRDVFLGICVGMCMFIYTGMCTGRCTGMCIGMCIGMCTGICIGICIGIWRSAKNAERIKYAYLATCLYGCPYS